MRKVCMFMGEVLRFPNIFKEFISVQEMVQSKEQTFLPEALLLLSSIKNYFESGVWAKSKTEYLIYTYAFLPYTTSEMADLLELKNSTYRSMVSRLSDRIRSIALDGVTISEIVFSQDRTHIQEIKRRIDFLYMRYDPYKNLPKELLPKVKNMIKDVDENSFDKVSDLALFDAANVLSRFSLKNIEAQFSALNPVALKKILFELQTEEYTKGLHYLRFCDFRNSSVKQVSKKEFIKIATQIKRME